MNAHPATKNARALRDRCRTLQLATAINGEEPTASYAPFIRFVGSPHFYIYTSGLSRHTKEMIVSKKASAMLIEDECASKNIFARKRIVFSCDVEIIERKTAYWKGVINEFEKAFGDAFMPVQPLGDFVLFCLKPRTARYIEGFGRAYIMDPDLSNPRHIGGHGHKAD